MFKSTISLPICAFIALSSIFAIVSAKTSDIPARPNQQESDKSVEKINYEALLDSAETYYASQHWNEAADMYEQALRLKPSSPLNSKIFANLGICLVQIGNYPKAIEAFNIALIREPESTKILSAKAKAHILSGDNKSAKEDLKKVLDIDPDYPEALRLYGQILLFENNLDEASSIFDNLMKVAPADPWGPAGKAEIEMSNSNYKKAVELWSKALEMHESPDIRISIISALLADGLTAEAESSIREAIANYPRQGEFYLLRAILNRSLHQNRDAERDKKYAVEYGVDPQTIEKYLPLNIK